MNTVLYASVACSQKHYASIFGQCEIKTGQAVQKYNRLIMEGMVKNEGVAVEAISTVPISKRSHDEVFFKKDIDAENGVRYHYQPVINIKKIKDIVDVISSFFCFIHLGRKTKKLSIVADVLNAPVAFGAYLASKVLGCPYIVTVTDDPKLCGCGWFYRKTSYHLIRKCDAYIFITEEMNKKYNLQNRPYIVMEGLVDVNETGEVEEEQPSRSDGFIVMYTGLLNKRYGVESLTRGFIEATIPNSELHFYGDGDYKEELVRISEEHDNIKYFGTVLSSEVTKIQKSASLLVNPRPIDEEYVKYSFPSKNMEYMVSGTPVLTTDLPGMPEEYKDYVFVLEDYSVEGIKNKLVSLSQMDKEQFKNMGRRARRFVLERKNNEIQAKRVLTMISNI